MVQVLDRKQSFLKAHSGSTRATYDNGLNKFEEFLTQLAELQKLPEYEYLVSLENYSDIEDCAYEFLRRVKADRNIIDPLDMKMVERLTIQGFNQYLLEKGYANNTVLVMVAAVQSFGQYWQVPISTKFTNSPNSVVANEKYEWTLDELGKFIESMKSQKYQSLSTTLLHSTLRPSDVLGPNLPYKLIKKEFENNTVPLCIHIKSSEKTITRHRTFLGSLAIRKLTAYFEAEGTPKPDEPVYPLSNRSMEEYFERHAHKLYPSWKGQNPYCAYSIRGAACTFLEDALCPRTAIEYFSGHGLDNDIALRYRRRSTNKWRAFWQKFEWALDYTVKPEDRPNTPITELKRIIDSLNENEEA